MSRLRSADEALRRLEEMAAQFDGKKVDPSAEEKKQAAAYNAAFWETMHTGMPQNSLKVGSDGAGGYLVPDTYEKTLVRALAEKNVIRQIAKTIPTTQSCISLCPTAPAKLPGLSKVNLGPSVMLPSVK